MRRSDPQPRDPLIGARIDGRYTVRGMLGRGGMGVVYDGVHDELGRDVAIKVLNAAWAADPSAVERFLREARTAGQLVHGNIVDVSDLGRLADGRPYLVMPKVRGTDLAQLLRTAGRQPPKRVADLLSGVGAALDLIHAKGFVHRDIKPENLMYVVREDGSETVMLLDFGIAALVASNEPRLTRQGAIFGTPEYLPPEVWDGKLPDGRGDVYALATVAFELMTAELPFVAENVMQILPLKLKSDAPRMGYVSGMSFPDAIEQVVARGLAREPNDRYDTASEFVSALRIATATAPISWRPGDIRASAAASAEPDLSLEEPLVLATDSAVLAFRHSDDDSKTFLEVPKPASDPPPTIVEGQLHQAAVSPQPVHAPTPSRTSDALASRELEPLLAGTGAVTGTATGAVTSAPSSPSTALPIGSARRFLPHAAALAVALLAVVAWASFREQAPTVTAVHEVRPAPEKPPAPQIEAPTAPSTIAVVDRPSAAETTPSAELAPTTPQPNPPAVTQKPKPARAPITAERRPPIVSAVASPSAHLAAPTPAPTPPTRTANITSAPAKPARDPAAAAQLTREGTSALLSGQVAHATELLRRAIEADPGHAPAYRSLGLAFERSGKTADAIASYDKYLKLDPHGAQADRIRERLNALRK